MWPRRLVDGHAARRRVVRRRVPGGAVVAGRENTDRAIRVVEEHPGIRDAQIAEDRFEPEVIARGNAVLDGKVDARGVAAETGTAAAARFHITHRQSTVRYALDSVAGHAVDGHVFKRAA